ncbi:unnamed protein product [Paramecium octaurelia]|uniref:Uncharacterized protein n=1 Tax=Paramecium octaurelia TaxID=43137 RepID=A0A8S1SM46_PAROT|nr:unnamed protein product [Paramecium octaurelia]
MGMKNYSLCGQSRFNHLSHIKDIDSHSSELITFLFTNNLDQAFEDESFGIRDARVYLFWRFTNNRQCSQFCGDQIIQQIEECNDGNSLPFDGYHMMGQLQKALRNAMIK